MAKLGELLVEAREDRGLTLEDAERDTRIARRYLEALEAETFDVIPAPVYTRGFLRSYSQYLGLDPQEALSLLPSPQEAQPPGRRQPLRDNRLGAERREARRRERTPAPSEPEPEPEPIGEPEERPTVGRRDRNIFRPETTFRPPTRPDAGLRRIGTTDHEPLDSGATVGDEPGEATGTTPASSGRRSTTRSTSTRRSRQEEAPATDAYEPVIGVDIGVATPATRLQMDPAARQRTMIVAAVAGGLVLLVIVIAFVLARSGGGDDNGNDALFGLEANSSATASASTGDTAGEGDNGASATAGESVAGVVPAVQGLSESAATEALAKAGYMNVDVRQERSSEPEGIVTTQAPGAETAFDTSLTVIIVVSSGNE